jgi:hypothetical protein
MLRRPLTPVLALLLLAGCSKPSTGRHQLDAALKNGRYDLQTDEDRGGHTLSRHVGRTDAELRQRLHDEPNLATASSYISRDTAERAVALDIEKNRDRVERWLLGGYHPNLPIRYTGDEAVGRSMQRREWRTEPCDKVLAVLKYAGRDDFYVLTSYPDCARDADDQNGEDGENP